MATLSFIEGKTDDPPRLFVYGTEGIGKSTFAASAPKPIFVQTEDGVAQIGVARMDFARSIEAVLSQLTQIRDCDHDRQTLVIDSMDALEQLIWSRICADYGVKSIEKVDGGYGRGYSYAMGYWRQVRELVDDIREKRNMGVILVAHGKHERYEDPEIGGFERNSPKLNKQACAFFCEWADAILFAHARTRVDPETKLAIPIGVDGGERVLRTIGSAASIAKNRYGLPVDIPLSWNAFMAMQKPVNTP